MRIEGNKSTNCDHKTLIPLAYVCVYVVNGSIFVDKILWRSDSDNKKIYEMMEETQIEIKSLREFKSHMFGNMLHHVIVIAIVFI